MAAREEAAAAAHATAEEAAEDLEARGLLDQFARFTVPPSPPVACKYSVRVVVVLLLPEL